MALLEVVGSLPTLQVRTHPLGELGGKPQQPFKIISVFMLFFLQVLQCCFCRFYHL